ncbi:O-antigen ligase domain-containing protein [Gulosibacter macacae]|uniref:O-antigen ligase domain-containing protein n=2 Tax=Gulosibacter macacae TaxID=2488791 RepID=A0A3P3VXJ6_9MICO|nr:O-antigen ligase domain-containing protein [Gulosibacter macacae]
MEFMSAPLPSPVSRTGPRAWWGAWMRGELAFTRTMALVAATLVVAFAGDMLRYTIGWPGYGAVVLVLTVLLGVAFVRRRSPMRPRHLPFALVAFVLWCGLSVIWSQYRGETLVAWGLQLLTAFAGLTMAVSLTRFQFLRALGVGMRLLVYGSLVFEAWVAVFSPGGLIPPSYLRDGTLSQFLGPDAPTTPAQVPANFYWSYGHLLDGGDLQGLPGNRNLLAMIALIAVVITVAELWDRQIGVTRAVIAIAAGVFVLLRTQSATVVVALAFIVLGAALVLAGRHLRRRGRWVMYATVGGILVAGATLVVIFNNEIFALMNRSSDMSGRGDIWRAVINLGDDSPLVGLGWISYWAPWLPQFKHLAVVEGTSYHQAHNSFLDVWMQTGFIGLVFCSVLVFTALIRTWWIAIDRPDTPLIESVREHGHPHLAGMTAVPFLIMVALVVQAMTESRLLIEGGWLFLCYASIYAKLRVQDPSLLPRKTLTARTGPINVIVDPVRDI